MHAEDGGIDDIRRSRRTRLPAATRVRQQSEPERAASMRACWSRKQSALLGVAALFGLTSEAALHGLAIPLVRCCLIPP